VSFSKHRATSAWNFVLTDGARSTAEAKPHRVWVVSLVFALLIAAQALGFVLLGTGRWGSGFSELILVVVTVVAIICTWAAFRRAQGVNALFWCLFTIALFVLLVPTLAQAYETLFAQVIFTESTWELLFCIYGAPILMMLFLPDAHGRARVKSEIFLDLFQIAIVVGLIYSTFFFLPVRQMLPTDALLHDISISDEQSLILLAAVFIRLRFARISSTRGMLHRLGLFVLVCAVATFCGDWILLNHPSVYPWFDLGWAIPPVAAGLVALTWNPRHDQPSVSERTDFLSFLGSNLVLVAMLSCVALLTNRWKEAHGETLTYIAIAASLVALTLRLALTQFHQQQEIAQRKEAQQQLTTAHQKVGGLLDDARRQTAEITQISELGSLLQACTSREEVFRLVPERLRLLFMGASGSISLLSSSRNRLDSVVRWGIFPTAQLFSPEDCWALRRGCAHVNGIGPTTPRCAHLLGEGVSACIPLITNGDSIGVLSIEEDGQPLVDAAASAASGFEALLRRRQLAATVAEQVALAIANLNLRESLRLQAVRDPLTGLYNRRYMEEFLERELHSARRKNRPLAVMMLDLDHFKRYNDNYGHSAGDRALAAFGQTLLRCVRTEDIACRYGGEEFLLILPECTVKQATMRAEEIRKRLGDSCASSDGLVANPLSVSIGIAGFDETTDRMDLLLKFADDALYQAKRAGRDRVIAARSGSTLPEPNGEMALTVASKDRT
jgi:diguanylate cyclase (GGDEF)-like protein